MKELRRFISLSLVTALGLWGGCDTLRARAKAQDGVEKYKNGELKQAAALFEEAAKIDPTVPPIQINRGFTHLAFYQLNPKGKEGADAASIAIDAFKKYMALPVTPEQKQKARDYLLQTFVDAHKYEEAVEYFKPQTEKNPPEIEAVTILGNIAKSMGKTPDARTWMKKRLDAEPKNPDGYNSLAIMDWEELCADSQCRLAPDKRMGALTMPMAQRRAIANHGIELAKKAEELAPNAPTAYSYHNLLLRERSYACIPEPVDPKVLKKDPNKAIEAQAAADECKRKDLEQAQNLVKKVVEMQKAAVGAAKEIKDAKDAKNGKAGAAEKK